MMGISCRLLDKNIYFFYGLEVERPKLVISPLQVIKSYFTICTTPPVISSVSEIELVPTLAVFIYTFHSTVFELS